MDDQVRETFWTLGECGVEWCECGWRSGLVYMHGWEGERTGLVWYGLVGDS